ncbi:hypothetical protein PPEV_gp181 [Pseudomonas phage EL]|uniref:Uncharacterized protein n=1 Tax=Pseudomonas phage EL TaxID=273133 RepID=Q2Z0Q0_9CAUD|nr:hypothetical protein [Pseudomonas aeruginosa]YP_418214.1 hypothetical protein PPEV_gp181 [Pseudomonas phage EL]MBS9731069.1 hypothetical protein [Pseudomonas aeruginosa]CAG27275.1 hypothetical protein [Pseudomonas phage EL]
MGILDGFNLSSGINAFKKETETAMRGVKSETLTPIDVTASRLKEGVALTNPNDTTLKSTITAYRSSVVEALDGVIGALSGGLLNTKDITRAIRIDSNGVSFSDDDLITAAGSQMGVNVWGKNGVKQLIADTLTAEFNRLTGLNVGQIIQVGYGDKGSPFRINDSWRTQLGSATLDMLRDYTGIDEFVDVSVQSAFYNAILYNSAMYGMSDSYKTQWDNYPYLSLRQDAFIEAIQYMITNGDVESISKVFELINTEGKNTLLSKYPDFIETLFTKFSFDSQVHSEEHPAIRTKLLNVLETVAGKEWYYRETQFGKAYNLGLVSNISDDMVTLLTPVEELIPLLTTRGIFQTERATDVLNQSFPNAPIRIK